jgi:steroid delta-isomerase-like uncharacterized protein
MGVMSEELRKLATRWFEGVWNERRPELIHELMAPECVAHLEGRKVMGPGEFEQVYHGMLEALPDMRVTVEDVVAERDNAVVRWVCHATHMGGDLLADGGRPVVFSGITWFQFRDGKIVEGWDRWNQAGLFFRPENSETH